MGDRDLGGMGIKGMEVREVCMWEVWEEGLCFVMLQVLSAIFYRSKITTDMLVIV